MSKVVTTALCFSMPNANQPQDEAGVWLPMIPAGRFTGVDGRQWNNSDPDGVVRSFMKKRPFDVEHSTQLKAPNGDPAPAVGWLLKVENRNGEIWAYIEWNQAGDELVVGKKYAFYSPAFDHTKDGTVTALVGSGLTNDPNLNVPSLNRKEANDMSLSALIREALKLGEDATEQDAVTAICSLQSKKETALNSVLKDYVPKQTHELALNRAKVAEDALSERMEKDLDELVQAEVDAGKIAPADKAMFVSLCRAEGGVEQFTAFVDKQSPIASSTAVKTPTDETKPTLADHEIALCRKMNITHDEFLAAKQSMKGAQ